MAVVAEIANFSPQPVRHLGVTLALDGAEVARGFRGRARRRSRAQAVRADHRRRAGARSRGGHRQGRLPAGRSARLRWSRPSRGLRVLIVDGDPRTVRTEDETFFLEAALRAGGSGFSVTSALPDELAEPRPLGLRRHLRRQREPPGADGGRGAGSTTSRPAAASSSRSAIKRRHRCLEPGRQGDLAAAARRWPAQRRRAARRARRGGDRRPPPGRAPGAHSIAATRCCRRFPAHGDGLSSARFFEYMLLVARCPDAPARRIVLRYESGAPALVEAAGRPRPGPAADDRRSTASGPTCRSAPGSCRWFKKRPATWRAPPPGEAAAAHRRRTRSGRSLLEPDDRRVEVVPPGGDSRWLIAAVAQRRRPRAPARSPSPRPTSPAFIAFAPRAATGPSAERPDAAFVVNLDPGESDPARLADEQAPRSRHRVGRAGVAPRPARHRAVARASAPPPSPWCCMESLLTLRFRRGRVKA